MTTALRLRFASNNRQCRGFTVIEQLLIVAVIGISSAMALTSMARFLQEQRLRQAAFELSAYLQSARARAQRENKICQLTISGTSLTPSSVSSNVCATTTAMSPALPSLDLAAVSGATGLAILSTSSGPITFSQYGVLASTPQLRILYLSANDTTVQRCVFLDLVSIRIGWRKGGSGACTYSSG